MEIQSIIEKALAESSWTKASLARLLKKSPQAVSDTIGRGNRKSLRMSTAIEMLDPLGYELVVVPKEASRLPKGSMRVSLPEEAAHE